MTYIKIILAYIRSTLAKTFVSIGIGIRITSVVRYISSVSRARIPPKECRVIIEVGRGVDVAVWGRVYLIWIVVYALLIVIVLAQTGESVGHTSAVNELGCVHFRQGHTTMVI
jgi:hypothetical protein